MRIFCIATIFCILSNPINAQGVTGFAEFEIKLAEDNFHFSGKLYFNGKSSKFISKQSETHEWIIKSSGMDQEYLTEKIYSDSIGHTVFTTLGKTNIKVREFCEPRKPIMYEDDVSINWVIKKETKEIHRLKCRKATTKFRGRKYEAWFTMDVPVPFGPWKFHGLPGLLIELHDLKKEVSINLKKLSMKNNAEEIETENGHEEWVKMADFYSCLNGQWEKSSEATKAKFARLQAEYPGLEIELETIQKRPATELEFE